jgi:hypothetical protein
MKGFADRSVSDIGRLSNNKGGVMSCPNIIPLHSFSVPGMIFFRAVREFVICVVNDAQTGRFSTVRVSQFPRPESN